MATFKSSFHTIIRKGHKKVPSEMTFFHEKSVFTHIFATFAQRKQSGMQLTQTILDDFKAGKLDSFYSEAYTSLLSYAIRILSSEYAFLAEDCVQDCIFRSYEKRDSLIDPASWKSLLYTSVHNSAVSILRHHSAQQNYLSAYDEQTEQDISLSIIEQETLDLLFAAIDSLPEKYRTIFSLSFEQGLSIPEIADQLNLSISGVKKQKSKMLTILRDKLPKDALAILLIMWSRGML